MRPLLVAAALSVFAAPGARADCITLPNGVVPYSLHDPAGAVTVITQPTTTATAVVQGALAYDTTANLLKVCDGTNWQNLAPITAAGSTGQIQFNNAGSLGADSGLFWNNSNKRLGVLTANPAVTLDVRGSAKFSSGTANTSISIGQKGDSIYYNSLQIWSGYNSNYPTWILSQEFDGAYLRYGMGTLFLSNYSSGTDLKRFTISSTGNVGIGIVNPSINLDVQGGLGSGLRVRGPISDNNWYGGIQLTNSTAAASGAYLSASVNGLFFSFGGTERMRISAGGLLGIGTTTPQATLDVNGFAKLKTNTSAPVSCSGTYEGSIAYTGGTTRYLCFCDGTNWKQAHDPATACAW